MNNQYSIQNNGVEDAIIIQSEHPGALADRPRTDSVESHGSASKLRERKYSEKQTVK